MVALIKGSPGRPVSTQGTASTFNWNAFGFSKRSRICYSRCGLARPALLSSLPVSLCLSPAYTTLFPSLHSLFPLTRTPSNIGIGIFPSFLPILPRILWNHKDLQGAAGREASERRRRDGREWDGTGRDGGKMFVCFMCLKYSRLRFSSFLHLWLLLLCSHPENGDNSCFFNSFFLHLSRYVSIICLSIHIFIYLYIYLSHTHRITFYTLPVFSSRNFSNMEMRCWRHAHSGHAQ